MDDSFEKLRPRLFGLAYRMLGSRAEAEDVVQDTYLRWHQTDRDAVRTPEAWLITAATRIAIDRLRALKTEREAYTGPWLPEPLMSEPSQSPDRALEVAADLSVAFLVMLERLAPEERAAFLLHDVFDREYGEIAEALGKTEAACRQIVHRARERVHRDQKRFQVAEPARIQMLKTFVAAVEARDEQTLFSLFAPDATWTADGGGKAAAAPYPFLGAPRIVGLLMGLQKRFEREGVTLHLALMNGEMGVVIRAAGRIASAISFVFDGERIAEVYAVVNPDKLPPVTTLASPPSSY